MPVTTNYTSLKLPPRTALEVFEMLPEGTLAEVINNTIYMSPAPNFYHQDICLDVAVEIRNFLAKAKSGKCVVAPADVYLDDKNIIQPDIVFISNSNLGIIQDAKIKGVPDLIIEILSTNRKYDLKDKKKLYESFGVPEYFIVDPATKETITYYHDGEKYVQQGSKPGKIKSKLLKKVFSF